MLNVSAGAQLLDSRTFEHGHLGRLDGAHQPAAAPAPTAPTETTAEILQRNIAAFHKNRCLELKNLPEGVTEQVRQTAALQH